MSVVLRAPRQHAVWTVPLPKEVGAPSKRSIHTWWSPVDPSQRLRVGFRPALGYLKCGSREETDWVRDARVHVWDGARWTLAAELTDVERPDGDSITWFDIDHAGATATLVEIRRSWIDDWWPGWNLAGGGVIIEPRLVASADGPEATQERGLLDVNGVELDGLPAGLAATVVGSSVRYRSDVLDVAFRLRSPAIASLAFDPDGLPDRALDLVKKAASFDHTGTDLINNVHHPLRGLFTNGPHYSGSDGREQIGFLASAFVGSTTVAGATVTYKVAVPEVGLEYDVVWSVERDALDVAIERRGSRDLVAMESSAWQIPFSSAATPVAPMVLANKEGETGLIGGTGWLHAPGSGSLEFQTEGDIQLRVDSARPQMIVDLELKVGERPTPLGSWDLPAGSWRGSARFAVTHGAPPSVRADAPDAVVRAIRRTWMTGLSYRADTATLSNNGNSIHATFCVDYWADLALAVGDIGPGLHAADLIFDTVERHFDRAPGYGAGATSEHPDGMESEYIQTDPAVLYAIGRLLEQGHGERFSPRAERIRELVDSTRGRDLDGDGLIESSHRDGTPGDDRWGTNWWDLIGFGWKDAWVNAILYGALRRLADHGSTLGLDVAALNGWAGRLRESYRETFLNSDTGWIAGWRDRDGALHDHAYLFVNGLAITESLLEPEEAKEIAERLLALLEEVGPPDYRAGLPGNLRPIPDALMANVFPDIAFPFYENGSQTLSQSRHFIGALYHVGLTADADRLLIPMLASLADGSAFGGCASGIDWRMWDGTPCGYEGILTDQFGVLGPAIHRWRSS